MKSSENCSNLVYKFNLGLTNKNPAGDCLVLVQASFQDKSREISNSKTVQRKSGRLTKKK